MVEEHWIRSEAVPEGAVECIEERMVLQTQVLYWKSKYIMTACTDGKIVPLSSVSGLCFLKAEERYYGHAGSLTEDMRMELR